MPRKDKIHDLARKHGIDASTLYARLKRDWSLEEALETPIMRKNQPLQTSKSEGSLNPLSFNKTYEFRVQSKHKYRLERITTCAAGPLALFRVGDTKALESFTVAQLADEGYRV